MAVEWTTESEQPTQPGELPQQTPVEPPPASYGNGYDTQPLPTHPPLPEESVTPPVTSVPPPVPTHAAPAPTSTPQALSGFEQCPSCGALVAVDQRYCLECGHRRGEPRLPFMDAVVFMDAMNRPPESASVPAKSKKRGISPNAALIAGVGTLLLALGIGVLIGRSGDNSSAPASQAPIVIKGGGGEETAATGTSSETETIGGGASTKGKSKKQIVKAKKQAAESGAGAEEVLHTAPGVNLPKATTKVGEKCDQKVAGCGKNGKFEGEFFTEE